MLELGAALAQLVSYVGVIVAVGAVLAELTLRAPVCGVQRTRSLAVSGSIVTLIGAACGLAVLMVRIGGSLDADTFALVWDTNVGTAAALRAGGALVVLASLALGTRELARIVRLGGAIAIATSFNYVGHAAAYSEAGGFAGALHVTLAAWWVASLLVLRAVYAHESVSAYAQFVQRFSRLAIVAIGLLVIAGIVMFVWLTPRPFVITPYVTWLALKIALAVGALGIATFNKLRLTPRLLAKDVAAAQTLDRSIVFELLVIGGVLIATAILTTYHSPDE